ncbi:MAG TPA: DUF2971 domain-containing protein [Bryobacteraceae bacterium]|nr:DUF2971 domain-containing protein [Bryobacteraceae bacterium]
MRSLEPLTISETLFHYTTSETGLHKILGENTLKLNDVRSVRGDDREVTYLRTEIEACVGRSALDVPSQREYLENLSRTFYDDFGTDWSIYVACFTQAIDQPLHWMRYADGGQGVAIGFDTATLKRSGFGFSHVTYDLADIRKKLDTTFTAAVEAYSAIRSWSPLKRRNFQFEVAAMQVVRLGSTTKRPDYSWEEEVRIVQFDDVLRHGFELRSFPASAVKQVILGRRCTRNLAEVEFALTTRGYRNVVVSRSQHI